jgi:LacI family transcriptional regulator
VSIATVSRVVNNKCRVEPGTAARVKRVISEIGYRPDAMARGMRHNRSYAVGYIVSDIANVHFMVAAKALEEMLAANDFSLIVCSTGGDKARERSQLDLLLSKKIDGLIINVSVHNDGLVVELSRQLPVVLLSRKVPSDLFQGDFVGNDGFRGAYELGRHVLSMGHRDIGLIRGPDNISTGTERFNGFVTALREKGIDLPQPRIHFGDYYQESGWNGAGALLDVRRPPSIIVAMNNAMAYGALACLRMRGVAIPGDISFASYGDIPNRELLFITPTCISQNPDQEGSMAGEILLRRMKDRGARPMTVLIPSQLLPGDSIRNLASKSKK